MKMKPPHGALPYGRLHHHAPTIPAKQRHSVQYVPDSATRCFRPTRTHGEREPVADENRIVRFGLMTDVHPG